MGGFAGRAYVTLFLGGKVHGWWTHDRGEGGRWSFRSSGKIAVMQTPIILADYQIRIRGPSMACAHGSVLLMVVINSRNAYVTLSESVHACL